MATTVTITGGSNPGASERSGTVTFTNADGQTVRVSVTQPGYTGSAMHTLTINLLTTDVTAMLTLTVDGDPYGASLGTAITDGTPYVDEFAHGAVVGWSIQAITVVGGPEYAPASGEVTMTSDQTVNVSLKMTTD